MEEITITENNEVGKDEMWCMWYKCPNCGGTYIANTMKYCPDCGLKIKWDIFTKI
jgi:predicted RNA-binding Zn-ribbon protein involved in translation (DUF1610 family)